VGMLLNMLKLRWHNSASFHRCHMRQRMWLTLHGMAAVQVMWRGTSGWHTNFCRTQRTMPSSPLSATGCRRPCRWARNLRDPHIPSSCSPQNRVSTPITCVAETGIMPAIFRQELESQAILVMCRGCALTSLWSERSPF